ncbi:hypothetical protein BC938DRAFT_478863, partial [Jimgerdemannia flammicorona]
QGGTIQVTGAKQGYLILAAGTNYNQSNGNAAANYSFKGADPHAKVSATLAAAAANPYSTLYKTHTNDYKKLYSAFTLNWDQESSSIPTDEAMVNYRITPNDPYVEWLTFNLGRYMLISSSRPGTLPANLQGKWAEGLQAPWSGDYHPRLLKQLGWERPP